MLEVYSSSLHQQNFKELIFFKTEKPALIAREVGLRLFLWLLMGAFYGLSQNNQYVYIFDLKLTKRIVYANIFVKEKNVYFRLKMEGLLQIVYI
jgi:hypothetical protein